MTNALDEPLHMVGTIATHLPLKLADKQKILEMEDFEQSVKQLMVFMKSELGLLAIELRIHEDVKKRIEKNQKEYYLLEKKKAIEKELGGRQGGQKEELDALKEKIKKAGMSLEARLKAEVEVNRLQLMSPMASESGVSRDYLLRLLSLPWKKRTKLKPNLALAETILNEGHYGLEKVKEPILEYLAVQQRVAHSKAPILCLVGPPGVGKTSLGESIARATQRHFVRMSLGGMRDEAEIRGHRRTYVGALPGKILQKMIKAGVKNPLFLLDEIDKMAMDFRGDPASALLEVLDPEQNKAFNESER